MESLADLEASTATREGPHSSTFHKFDRWWRGFQEIIQNWQQQFGLCLKVISRPRFVHDFSGMAHGHTRKCSASARQSSSFNELGDGEKGGQSSIGHRLLFLRFGEVSYRARQLEMTRASISPFPSSGFYILINCLKRRVLRCPCHIVPVVAVNEALAPFNSPNWLVDKM